jgi:hypothetical protein
VRCLLLGLVVIAGMAGVQSAFAENWTVAPPGTERSKEIKAMNILDRPNRPLHIYGDVVRLANRRHNARS